MKRIVPLLLILLLLLPSCSLSGAGGELVQTDTDALQTASDAIPIIIDGETTAVYTEQQSVLISETSGVKVTVPAPTAAEAKTAATVKATTAYATTALTTLAAATSTKPSSVPASTAAPSTAAPVSGTAPANELRGIWLSCYEFPNAGNMTKAEFTAAADTIFKNIKSLGLNAAFVHVRAFSDSFYPSNIFPWSKYVSGEQGKSPGYDTLAIMLSAAKKYGIAFHAWINPFRVSSSSDYAELASSNPARKIIENGNKNGDVCILSNGIYYCPASTAMHELILSGVKEILDNYAVDGIHIDDYFYPSTSESVDKIQYKSYTDSGGTLSLSQWRKSCVNSFVSALYRTAKAYGNITVSVSPSGMIADNTSKHYADSATWLSRTGYADIIIPQIYFGFNHPSVPFKATLKSWADMKKSGSVRLACGLAAYKCGIKDTNAGNASGEWIDNNDMLLRQLTATRQNGNYSGFVLFSYSYMFPSPSKAMQNEITNLKTIL